MTTVQCTGCMQHLPPAFFHDALKWRRCKECVRASMRNKYHACPDTREGTKLRNRTKLLERYGLTWKTFHALLDSQEGKCKICGNELTAEVSAPRARQACVDHDHTTGKVRGVLCSNCNLALGYLKDSVTSARNAVTYLEVNSD